MGNFFGFFLTNSHLHCRKRTRYYQSMIDMDSLMKGQDYSELKDSYILFICKRDPFKDDFTNRLSALVEQIKANEKFRRDYAAMNLHDRDITRAAKQEGANEKAVENAITLVQKYNVSPESAAKDMNAPLDKVLESLSKSRL